MIWIQIITQEGVILTEEGPYMTRDFAELQIPEMLENMRLFFDTNVIVKIIDK